MTATVTIVLTKAQIVSVPSIALYRKVGVTGGQLSTKEPEARPQAYQGQLYLRPHGYFQREP